jgi:hypothetical protein
MDHQGRREAGTRDHDKCPGARMPREEERDLYERGSDDQERE